MGASGTAVAAAAAAVGEDGDGAGLLVAQILESKKELEDGRRNAYSPETPGHRRVQIVSQERGLVGVCSSVCMLFCIFFCEFIYYISFWPSSNVLLHVEQPLDVDITHDSNNKSMLDKL